MSQSVQIVIVSLCTLLNVNDSEKKLPPPSVVIPRADATHGGIMHPHIGFFGWDSSTVDFDDSDGSTGTVVNDDTTAPTTFRYLPLDGDLIVMKSPPPAPLVTTGLTDIAVASKYWKSPPSTKEYDSRFGPKGLSRNNAPDEDFVAGFMHLAGGTLTTSRPTTVIFQFKDKGRITQKGCFMREVNYRFAAQEMDGNKTKLTIELQDLDGAVNNRTLTFTAKTPNTDLEIFLGNDTKLGMYFDMARVDTVNIKSDHFMALHQQAHTKANAVDWPLPEPTATACSGTPVRPVRMSALLKKVSSSKKKMSAAEMKRMIRAAGGHGGGGDETGYCGPDGKP